jgi:hypothetical protein
MQLTHLKIENFKACRRVDLELAPLTVLIGANNAGKSSALHSLALLAQSDPWFGVVSAQGSLVDLGRNPAQLIHQIADGDRADAAEIQLRWEDGGEGHRTVTFTARISPQGPATRLAVSFPAADLGTVSLEAALPEGRGELQVGGERAPDVDLARGGTFGWTLRSRSPQGAEIARLVEPYLERYPRFLERFRYVGPNRHVERSTFPLGESASTTPRTAQELVDTLAYEDELRERVSARCDQLFGYGIRIDLFQGRQVALQAVGKTGTRNVVNVGTGLVQVVWLLTELELALQGRSSDETMPIPLVGIEEPELHLHPALQPDVARILAAFSNLGIQLVCTTQSDHLLMSLLSLVLEGVISPGSLAVYYLEEGSADRLAVDERGRIEGGLRGFFEANEQQLRRHVDLLKSHVRLRH